MRGVESKEGEDERKGEEKKESVDMSENQPTWSSSDVIVPALTAPRNSDIHRSRAQCFPVGRSKQVTTYYLLGWFTNYLGALIWVYR